MPDSATTPGRPSTCDSVLVRIAFRLANNVGTRNHEYFAARWLAYAFPCRRLADVLTDADARLGAGVGR